MVYTENNEKREMEVEKRKERNGWPRQCAFLQSNIREKI